MAELDAAVTTTDESEAVDAVEVATVALVLEEELTVPEAAAESSMSFTSLPVFWTEAARITRYACPSTVTTDI